MFIAMNRFTIAEGRGAEFETRWRGRSSYLKDSPGFVRFRLLKLDETHYSSYAEWESEAAFRAWTTSEGFRKAHGQRLPEGILAGHPHLETWEVILDEA
ncbi:MAG: antibiotic biosynthesis monooxygenase [Candidatus Lambdaproteobacteria bacterium]|nr:antibiotic biosynthesis monooxygenase [Candidatus Lambdaproteobacteria bacterium]